MTGEEAAAIAEQLDLVLDQLYQIQGLLGTIEGFLLFGAIVILCFFVYKFFRIFF